jgi:hypothetical protein
VAVMEMMGVLELYVMVSALMLLSLMGMLLRMLWWRCLRLLPKKGQIWMTSESTSPLQRLQQLPPLPPSAGPCHQVASIASGH